MAAPRHTHTWTTGRSTQVETCACGKWRFTEGVTAIRGIDLRTAPARKTWTIAAIADANTRAGFFFFSRDTMRFFGDTRASFRVVERDGRVFVVRRRAQRNAPAGYQSMPDVREFDPATGDISGKRASVAEFFAQRDGSAVQS